MKGAAALLAVVFFLLGCAQAAILAIDLGAQFFKVAIIKPGAGLDIALNEQSKRKTPSAIAFADDGERLFGDAAVTYSSKFPDRAILNSRDQLGKVVQSEGKLIRTNTSVVIKGETVKLAPEVPTAMLLALAKKFASNNMEESGTNVIVRDCVITVPAWFQTEERGALVDAARLAGLNVLGLINTNTATGLKILFDAKDEALKQTILVYDVGASGASASVLKISKATSGKEEKLSIDALSHSWDRKVAGMEFDELLADYLAGKFDETRAGEESVKTIPRVMARLRKEAQRLREVLSANSEFKVTRGEFEELAEGIFERVMTPVKQALKDANVQPEELDAVVPFGGVSRTPRVQAELLAGLGREALNKSVNTDEAAAIGALWYAASMSSLIKSKKVEVIEHLDKDISVAVGRDSTSTKSEPQVTKIFDQHSGFPQKKTVNFKRKKDFNISVFWGDSSSSISSATLASYQLTEVESIFKKMQNATNPPSPKVTLTFALDKSGLLDIQKAETTIEETILVETVIPVSKTTDKGKSNATESAEDVSGETPSASSGEETDAPSASPTAEKQERNETKVERKPQLTVHKSALTKKLIRGDGSASDTRMTPMEFSSARSRLSRFDEQDKKRHERADSLNSLESAIFSLRENLYDEKLEEVSTDDERQAIRQALEDAEEWIFSAEEEASTASALRAKEKTLRSQVDRLYLRVTEAEARPKAVEELQKAVSVANTTCVVMRQLHEEKKSESLPKIDQFAEEVRNASEWLTLSLQAQKDKGPKDDPAFLSAEASERAMTIAKGAAKIQKLRLPRETTTASSEPQDAPGDEESSEKQEL